MTATIEPNLLPVIISSINPCITQSQPVIAAVMTEAEKHSTICQLESESTIWGIATDLAIQAGEETKSC
jgi:hypothetical protein